MTDHTITLCFHEEAGQVDRDLLNAITATLERDTFSVMELNLAKASNKTITSHFKASEVVIAYGGDGTVHHVLQHLLTLSEPPTFAIIPGGTANDFARTLNMPINPVKAAETIINQQTKQIDVGQFNDRYFLNFFGIGLVTETKQAVSASESKQTFGRFSYYLNSLQTLNAPEEPFSVTVKGDNHTYEGNAMMVMVGNGQYTGGVRAFFNQADMTDGAFDVLIIKNVSARSLFDIVKANITPDPKQLEGIEYFRTSTLDIKTTPPQQIDCDGEDGGVTPVTLKVLPKHITMITGETSLFQNLQNKR
ncbi:lipid kinase, YegS/Rv2252/BmrU family [Halolactibacillus halophilus]|uniref:Bis(5'-nucleosyl)-tetraphosphatase n=1 Tax=Halolactibacillus halophilus TaxID=306540 RepID=A0A1I5QAT0_9BACI|nr:diacylglycerol kinase family protein [Halolactibacillus halophilus]GEM01709.1 bis(5'-nucleosyl)-tetraphosphatase [Halolactibacillus halophilus]SFP43111.1 lipid kinase, YegS/Rv2252/BmrU family [Halolactibacillus halophilus]